jgi:hypothetical protein
VRDGKTETVTPKFEQAIPNIPGKSFVTQEIKRLRGFACRMHFHPPLCVSGGIESMVNDDETRVDEVAKAAA